MGAAKDYRQLVSREPPEGLREWTLKHYRSELDRYGLVYETEHVPEYGLAYLLDEWSPSRKRKMVRVKCSCCGESTLLNWAKDERHGYGFILPDDEEGDWGETVTSAGDEVRCPMCNEMVLVNKRAAIRDYYVTAECHVMSADVLDGGELVLTGWTAQRRVFKSGSMELKLLPAEAYVFTAEDCIQLMGWRNGYSGNCGYFIQYGPWRQPQEWRERWGQEDDVFGLTAGLIDRSRLPHCKLDAYMAPRPGSRHYPVAWLRLYQAHPNVEAVLLHGLPRVLDGLIAARTEAKAWEKNTKGLIDLPEIDWEQTRPAQMLWLTREELRMARAQDWEKLFWDLFVDTKHIAGERLTGEDIQNAFYLGDEHVTDLIPRGQVGKSIRYLLRQCELLNEEIDDMGADPIPDAQLLTDYWTMAGALGRDLAEPSVKYPPDLIAAHDQVEGLMRQKEADDLTFLFRARRKVLRKYAYAAHGLLIRPAASQRELTAEGDALRHCVGTYGERHAKGETAIFFIRRVGRPRESFYTLELDEKELKVRQNRGKRNCGRTPEVEAFEAEWLAWVRVGAPRSRDGKPVRPGRSAENAKRKKEAAYKELIERGHSWRNNHHRQELNEPRCIIAEMTTALETLLAERGAAVEELRGICWCCAHGKKWDPAPPLSKMTTCEHIRESGALARGGSKTKCPHWEWRGPQKEPAP